MFIGRLRALCLLLLYKRLLLYLRLLLVLFNHDILCNYSMLVIRRVYYLECLLSQVAGMLCPVWVIFHSNIDDAWYHACLDIPPAYFL